MSQPSEGLLDLVLADMEEHHLAPDDVLFVGDWLGTRVDWKGFEAYAKRVDISNPLQRAYLDELYIRYLEDGEEMDCLILDLLEEAGFDEGF